MSQGVGVDSSSWRAALQCRLYKSSTAVSQIRSATELSSDLYDSLCWQCRDHNYVDDSSASIHRAGDIILRRRRKPHAFCHQAGACVLYIGGQASRGDGTTNRSDRKRDWQQMQNNLSRKQISSGTLGGGGVERDTSLNVTVPPIPPRHTHRRTSFNLAYRQAGNHQTDGIAGAAAADAHGRLRRGGAV